MLQPDDRSYYSSKLETHMVMVMNHVSDINDAVFMV